VISHLQNTEPEIKLVQCGERLPVFLSQILRLGLRSYKDCSSTNQSSSTAETGVVCVAMLAEGYQGYQEGSTAFRERDITRFDRVATTELASPLLLPSLAKTSRRSQSPILHHTKELPVSAQRTLSRSRYVALPPASRGNQEQLAHALDTTPVSSNSAFDRWLGKST
jgi:hypothetical protein